MADDYSANRGESRNACETFTATEGGTYYVSVGAWRDGEGHLHAFSGGSPVTGARDMAGRRACVMGRARRSRRAGGEPL